MCRRNLVNVFVTLLLLAPLMGQGQVWDPIVKEGKLWISCESGGNDPQNPSWSKSHAILMGDTINFYGTIYNKLQVSFDEQLQTWFDYGLIREDSSKKVWFQTYTCGPERLLYDFGAQSGETINITHTTPGTHQVSGNYHIGTVDSIFLLGKERLRMAVGNGYWIEGIGSTSGLMFSGLEDITSSNYSLLCYHEDSTATFANDHMNPFYPACWSDIITATIAYQQDQNFLYPNPAKDIIYAHFTPGSHYRIIDISGRILGTDIIADQQQEIDISGFVPGVYFIHIKNKPGEIFKFMVR